MSAWRPSCLPDDDTRTVVPHPAPWPRLRNTEFADPHSLCLKATIICCWEGNGVSTIVEEKVIGIVSEQLGVPKEEVKLESSIIEDLKADSLDVVELVMELEDEFDITIPDDDYEKLKTVGDAIKYIDEKK
jgi:acyl carrier protein